MLGALSTNRNFNNCCNRIRPYIAIIEPFTETSETNGGGGGGNAGDIDFDNLTVNSLIANTIQSGIISTTVLSASRISTFQVPVNNDVTFFGSSVSSSMRWASSENVLYLENSDFKTSACFLYLNNPSNETPPTTPDIDIGTLFKWRDSVALEDKQAFIGYKGDTERFRFIPNVSVNDCVVTPVGQENGDFEVQDIYLRGIVATEDDLTITVNDELGIVANNFNVDIATNITFASTSGDMLTSVGGDITTELTGTYGVSITGGANETLTIDNQNGIVNIISGSSDANAIALTTTFGGISASADSSIDMTSNTNISMTTGTVQANVDETNGLTVNKSKDDYLRWISYKDFDAFSGLWTSRRDLDAGVPYYYWEKDIIADVSQIFATIDLSSRLSIDKGYQLTGIYVVYEIRVETLNSITPLINSTTFNPNAPTATPTRTNIPFTGTLGTSIDYHYELITLDTPQFINTNSQLSIEFTIDSAATSEFKFLGIHLAYNRNDT